jgi:hypothetical protein
MKLACGVMRRGKRFSGDRVARAVIAALVLAGLVAGMPRLQAGAGAKHADAATASAGWAMDAYPGDSVATLKSEMQKQVSAGANIVWLGHNNPGEVNQKKGEPGLSFAVWEALQDTTSPRHTDAVAMTLAVQHALDAARSLGVPVVLPIGYQIQMGAVWNRAHPQDLRVDAQGKVYNAGGESASFYAPDYQHDIVTYYRWVDETFVQPYSDTVKMLNMADEPADGDFSTWANAAFGHQHGFNLKAAGANPQRQAAVGRFEAEYIVNYAAWSAGQWLTIDPAIKVTVSFDGGYSRIKHEGPDLEAIFREAPANFVVTFDAYPKDGLYNTSAHSSDIYALFSLIRTLGHYSAVYSRPLWLWSAANSWGLNGASPDPGTIADAAANGIYLAQLARETGGDLQGIAVWNYNIKGQGLYNDTHPYYYDPGAMFARVSATFPLLRAIMSTATAVPAQPVPPATVILASNAHDLQVAGRTLAMRAVDGYDWTALAAFAHDDVPAPVVTRLDSHTLPGVSCVVVLDRAAIDVTSGSRAMLAKILGAGGTVIASGPVAALLAHSGASQAHVASSATSKGVVVQYALAKGRLYAVKGIAVEQVFADANQPWASGLVLSLFHKPAQRAGFVVGMGGATLLYGGLAAQGASFVVNMPFPDAPSSLAMVNTSGAVAHTIKLVERGGALRIDVPRRTYALATATGLAS